MDWEEALEWAEYFEFAGYDDYGLYWSNISHIDAEAEGTNPYAGGVYVVVGKGVGIFNFEETDSHGAGSQGNDPKECNREDYPTANMDAPQGNEQKIFKMIRLVCNAK